MDLEARDIVRLEILSPGILIGLAFDALAGLISAIASLIILILIFRRIYRSPSQEWEAMDSYVIALFAVEVVQGISHAMDVKWVIEGKTYTGTFCTGQGIMQQLGETGVALATLTIAVQTFVTIWWLKDPTNAIALTFISIQWLFIVLFVAIGFGIHTHPPTGYYATPTPYWCWIGQGFKAERLAGEYIWFWLTLFVSIALYIPLYLLHLEVVQPGDAWYLPSKHRPPHPRAELPPAGAAVEHVQLQRITHPPGVCHVNEQALEEEEHTTSPVVSRTPPKLWTAVVYPCLYCVLILPLSVVRWIGFRQEDTIGESHISPIAIFIAAIIFLLSGVLNALLYRLTRTEIFREKGGPATAPDVDANP